MNSHLQRFHYHTYLTLFSHLSFKSKYFKLKVLIKDEAEHIRYHRQKTETKILGEGRKLSIVFGDHI